MVRATTINVLSPRDYQISPQFGSHSHIVCSDTVPPNTALLTDAFRSLRCACGAAKRERSASHDCVVPTSLQLPQSWEDKWQQEHIV
jgi:hypothetical protein